MTRLFQSNHESVVRIAAQLSRLRAATQTLRSTADAPATPTPEQLAIFIETAFWASLRSNEGRPSRFCATLGLPEAFPLGAALRFTEPVPFDEEQIAKIAPAVPLGGCLGVSMTDENFSIWGFVRARPSSIMMTVTVDVSEPGIVRVAVGPFSPYSVLDGRSNPVISGNPTSFASHVQQALHKELPPTDVWETQAVLRECLAFADLAKMIMAEGHGGTLLIVPDDDTSWERSLSPFVHRFIVPDATIPDLIRQDLARLATQGDVVQRVSALAVEAEEKSAILGGLSDDRPADMTLLVRPIVSLAAVDGAVVLKNDLRIIGFGAKISVKGTSNAQFFSFRPKAGGSATQCEIEDLGGTRHQSSARFVAANRNATALVISQDRHISIMSWNADVDGVAIVRNAEWWL